MSFDRKPIKTLDDAKAAWVELSRRELPDLKPPIKKDAKLDNKHAPHTNPQKKDAKHTTPNSNPQKKSSDLKAPLYSGNATEQKAAIKIQKLWRKIRDKNKLDQSNPYPEVVYFLNQQPMMKSLDKKSLNYLQQLIDRGAWNNKFFVNPRLPYLAITLYATNKISSQQAYSCLYIYQARQQFKDLKGCAVLDEKGNFTPEAEKYLLPSLNKSNLFTAIEKKLLDSFKLLILTLPVSERYFFMANLAGNPNPTDLTLQLAVNGTFLSNIEYASTQFIYLTAGLKDAVGITRFGVTQHARCIPRLGVQTKDDIEAGIRKDIRPSAIRIDGKQDPMMIHEFKDASPLIVSMHDDYHRDILSSIPSECRRGIERLIDITRENILKKPWSREIWDWVDNENRYFMMNLSELDAKSDKTVLFCDLLSNSTAYGDERGGFLINYKESRVGELTMLGANFIIDMIEHKDKWVGLGIDPDKLVEPFKHLYIEIKNNFQYIKNPDRNIMIFNCQLYQALQSINRLAALPFLIDFFKKHPLPLTYHKMPKSNRIQFLIGQDQVGRNKDLISAITKFIVIKNKHLPEVLFNSDLSAVEIARYSAYQSAKNVTHEQAVYLAQPTFGNWFSLNKKSNACVALTLVGLVTQCFYYKYAVKKRYGADVSAAGSPALFNKPNDAKFRHDNKADKHTVYAAPKKRG
jgi:hypothetical protein